MQPEHTHSARVEHLCARHCEPTSTMPPAVLDEWVTSVQRSSELDASVGETFEKLCDEHLPDDTPGCVPVRSPQCCVVQRCMCAQGKPPLTPLLATTFLASKCSAAELRYRYSIRMWNRVEQHSEARARVKGENRSACRRRAQTHIPMPFLRHSVTVTFSPSTSSPLSLARSPRAQPSTLSRV